MITLVRRIIDFRRPVHKEIQSDSCGQFTPKTDLKIKLLRESIQETISDIAMKNYHCCGSNTKITETIAIGPFQNQSIFLYHFRTSLSRVHRVVFIPPATKLGGGILESPCPSVCLSVRLSVDARG